MSIRAFTTKFVYHGRQILQNATQKQLRSKVLPRRFNKVVKDDKGRDHRHEPTLLVPAQRSLIYKFIRNSYVNSFICQLRRKWLLPAQRFGQAVGLGVGTPMFVFLGINQTGNQLNNPNDDTLCQEIRALFSKEAYVTDDREDVAYSLDNILFGEIINKGCDAAVYEAQLKRDCDSDDDITVLEPFASDDDGSISECSSDESMTSDDQSFVTIDEDDFLPVSSPDNLVVIGAVDEDDDDIVIIKRSDTEDENRSQEFPVDIKFNQQTDVTSEETEDKDYDLAVKVMFNYGIESNSSEILRVMKRELIPDTTPETNDSPVVDTKKLPTHFNIVDMKGQFIDEMPDLSKSMEHFPDALPQRLYKNGHGRNKTLFLVMKRYSKTLREYLSESHPSMQTRISLLIQLLDGVSHMMHHGIAHRDLKSNNILIDDSGDVPHLVICDFGNCLADETFGLRIPYQTEDVNKGGNSALMAPEIKCAKPGASSVLDYSKSDMWSAATIAYEIFGAENPFYQEDNKSMDSRSYCESYLPDLPEDVPNAVKNLIATMLRRNPSKRPSVGVALNILHMHLWGAPDPKDNNITSDIKLWLLVTVARFLMETCFKSSERKMELQMKANMLKNINLQNLSYAYDFITQPV